MKALFRWFFAATDQPAPTGAPPVDVATPAAPNTPQPPRAQRSSARRGTRLPRRLEWFAAGALLVLVAVVVVACSGTVGGTSRSSRSSAPGSGSSEAPALGARGQAGGPGGVATPESTFAAPPAEVTAGSGGPAGAEQADPTMGRPFADAPAPATAPSSSAPAPMDTGTPPGIAPAAPASPAPRGGDSAGRGTPAVNATPAATPAAPPAVAPEPAGAERLGVAVESARRDAAKARGLRTAVAVPGTLPAPHEELWIIHQGENAGRPRQRDGVADDRPGCGTLLAASVDGRTNVPVPLTHTQVDAHIDGYIASVNVRQQFENPFQVKIEAVYVFPLPGDAAVNDFVMIVGERRIRGIIRPREEAEQIYAQARGQGYVASLLTQERPNVFTQRVANIEPGRRIDVRITYFHALAYDDGAYEFVFPMVVGPRFNPPGHTGGIGAEPRTAPGSSGQPVGVAYLTPGERSDHQVSLRVSIDAGVSLEGVESRSHVIHADQVGRGRTVVTLAQGAAVANKDFVLRFRVAGQTVRTALLTHRPQPAPGRDDHPASDAPGYFTLMLVPPAQTLAPDRRRVEFVFVLDCSGSMSGVPLAQAKAAMRRALQRLTPDDTFQIVRFSDRASALGPGPLAATRANVRRALEHVEDLRSEGGTMMIEGIRAALAFEHQPDRARYVVFLTDGYIGNEDEVLGEMTRLLGPSRVFSFGVGSAVNRALLDAMARLGCGAAAYLAPDDPAADIMDRFFDRVSRPALTDVSIDFGGLAVEDVWPARLPDLWVGRPVVVTGRFRGEGPTTVTVRGRRGVEKMLTEFTVPVDPAGPSPRPGVPAIWARTQIAALCDGLIAESASGPALEAPAVFARVRELALTHALMSSFTAFVAVDASRVTEGEHGLTVLNPVPVPEGVRYDTTVPASP